MHARVAGHAPIDPSELLSFERDHLRGADFTDRTLVQFTASASRFDDCRFESVRIDDGSFGVGDAMSVYEDCSFDRSTITFRPGGHARFVRCSFREIDIREWICFSTELVECVFTGIVHGAVFNGTVPERDRRWAKRERNEFRGNDFSGAELRDVGFRTGIDLSAQRLPSGDPYLYIEDGEAAVRELEQSAGSLRDVDAGDVRAVVQSLRFELRDGQRQLLLRVDGFTHLSTEARQEVVGVLARHAHP